MSSVLEQGVVEEIFMCALNVGHRKKISNAAYERALKSLRQHPQGCT